MKKNISITEDQRIEMTLKCKDSDHIPRCSNAGKILKMFYL